MCFEPKYIYLYYNKVQIKKIPSAPMQNGNFDSIFPNVMAEAQAENQIYTEAGVTIKARRETDSSKERHCFFLEGKLVSLLKLK